jgi:hypothetical protein
LKRKESIFLVVQAAIVLGVLLLVSLPIQSTNLQSDSSISVQGVQGPCSSTPVSTQSLLAPIRNETRLSNGTSVNETFYPTLFLQPNSTGVICVTYADASGAAISLVAGHNYFAGAFNITKLSTGGETTSIVPISTSILNISANPAEIHVQAGQSEVVAYTLRSSSNSTGLYQAFFPPGSCAGLPVFVGGSASQVNATEYSQLAFISNYACTDMYGNLHVESIAFSNIGVNYVGQPSNGAAIITA